MLCTKIIDSKKTFDMGFDIGYIQLDNHSEVDPIFPVVLKPKYKREYDFKKI